MSSQVTRFLIAEGRPSDVTQDQWVQENRSEALSWLGFLELLSKGGVYSGTSGRHAHEKCIPTA